jgi:hypothetical protein
LNGGVWIRIFLNEGSRECFTSQGVLNQKTLHFITNKASIVNIICYNNNFCVIPAKNWLPIQTYVCLCLHSWKKLLLFLSLSNNVLIFEKWNIINCSFKRAWKLASLISYHKQSQLLNNHVAVVVDNSFTKSFSFAVKKD